MYRFKDPAIIGAVGAVAGSAIAFLDPMSKAVSATCWESSNELHSRAHELLLKAFTTGILGVPYTAAVTPTSSGLLRLRTALQTRCESDPELMHAVETLGLEISERTRLIFYSAHYPSPSVTSSVDAPTSPALDVVVPFRCRGPDTSRLHNLTAVLAELKQQQQHTHFTTIVVEQDDEPRNRETILGRADVYVHHPYGGPFSRAAAINCGVRAGTGDALCLLDGDIMPDERFFERCQSMLADGGRAVLPYTDMFCLDEPSSKRVIDNSLVAGDHVSGYLIRHPPGACLWLTRTAFDEANGFDERFVGWGGEDRDFYNRLSAVAPIERTSDLLIHLIHDRPPMRGSRADIMGVLGG